eukprot:42344-Eustigmatos_ZCMA.PRE.1
MVRRKAACRRSVNRLAPAVWSSNMVITVAVPLPLHLRDTTQWTSGHTESIRNIHHTYGTLTARNIIRCGTCATGI